MQHGIKVDASTLALFPEAAGNVRLPGGRRSATVSLSPVADDFLRAEANRNGMGVSQFVLFLLGYYREHMEEIRQVSQPMPVSLSVLEGERRKYQSRASRYNLIRKREKVTAGLDASEAEHVDEIARANDTTSANVIRFAAALLHIEAGVTCRPNSGASRSGRRR